MIRYYGHHPSKQFIRGKPIRFGFKFWCCCTTDGYLVRFEPYQGAEPAARNAKLGVGGSVVIRLLSQLPKYPYKVYFDNLFTLVALLEALKNKGIGATSTVRANRTDGGPIMPVDRMKKEARGTSVHRREKEVGLVMARWQDNNVVTAASTADKFLPMGSCSR